MKEPLALIRRWYEEGFVDSEFLTKDTNALIPDIGSANFGMLFGPYWAGGWPLPDTKAVHPEADWYFYDLPSGPSGNAGRFGMTLGGVGVGGIGFKKGTDPQKIVAAIELWNHWIERTSYWLDNQDYIYYTGPIFEGYDYVWEGDEIKPGPTNIAGPWAYCARQLANLYPDMLIDFYRQVDRIKQDGPKNAYEKYLTQDTSVDLQRQAYLSVFNSLDTAIYDEFLGSLPADLAELNSGLSKLESQMYVDIISGNTDLDAFDTFVEDWKSQGGDEVTAAVNEWYGRSK
jgi:putative aldouronate transport system substrate-binding protein